MRTEVTSVWLKMWKKWGYPCSLFGCTIHPSSSHPTLESWITPTRFVIAPEQEGLVEVDRGAVPWVPGKTHRGLLKNAPTLDQLMDCTMDLFSV